MKILYYSPHPTLNLSDASGYGTHIREMIAAFRELGNEVLPVIIGGTTPAKTIVPGKSFFLKSVIKESVPGYLWESIKDNSLLKKEGLAYKTLLSEIERFKPDLIYERAAYLQESGSLAARKTGVRHVVEVNAPFSEEKVYFSGKSFFLKKAGQMESRSLKNAERIVTVSSALKDFLIRRYDIPSGQIIVVPNGINASTVSWSQEEVEKLRIRFSLSGKTVIGFVGSFFRYHGIDIMLNAFRHLLNSHGDLKLLIVGDGQILPELKNLSKELKIESNVIFTGTIPHSAIYNYIQLMDIGVMARSNWYGSPVKIFEYGAMGKAIIAPDVSPVRDVMEHGKDGLLVKPDADSISAAMLTLIKDPEKRKAMGLSFQAKVFQSYNWRHAAESILLKE